MFDIIAIEGAFCDVILVPPGTSKVQQGVYVYRYVIKTNLAILSLIEMELAVLIHWRLNVSYLYSYTFKMIMKRREMWILCEHF